MAMDINIVGSNIDVDGNLKISAPEGVIQRNEVDAGVFTGTPLLRSPAVSINGRAKTSIDQILFQETFNYNAQNFNTWNYTNNTMSAVFTGAYVNIGAVPGTNINQSVRIRSYQFFNQFCDGSLRATFNCGFFSAPLTSTEIVTFGFGMTTGTVGSPITDGIGIQIDNTNVQIVARASGAEQSVIVGPTSMFTIGNFYKVELVISQSRIEMWKNDVFIGSLDLTLGTLPTNNSSWPIEIHKYCTGATSSTNTFRLTEVSVEQCDIVQNRPIGHQASLMGRSSTVSQTGYPTTGKTSIWTNNTAPTPTGLTNTTASTTGLGGIIAWLPTAATSVDGIACSYLNPAVTTYGQHAKNLIITGVKLTTCIQANLVGGPLLNHYAIAYGHTAVSLATTEGAATHAPRIVPLGLEVYVTNAAQGTAGSCPQGHSLDLSQSPIVVRPGEYIQLLVRNAGTATTAGQVNGVLTFIGYWD